MDGATLSETCQLLKRNVTTRTIQKNGSLNRLYEKLIFIFVNMSIYIVLELTLIAHIDEWSVVYVLLSVSNFDCLG